MTLIGGAGTYLAITSSIPVLNIIAGSALVVGIASVRTDFTNLHDYLDNIQDNCYRTFEYVADSQIGELQTLSPEMMETRSVGYRVSAQASDRLKFNNKEARAISFTKKSKITDENALDVIALTERLINRLPALLKKFIPSGSTKKITGLKIEKSKDASSSILEVKSLSSEITSALSLNGSSTYLKFSSDLSEARFPIDFSFSVKDTEDSDIVSSVEATLTDSIICDESEKELNGSCVYKTCDEDDYSPYGCTGECPTTPPTDVLESGSSPVRIFILISDKDQDEKAEDYLECVYHMSNTIRLGVYLSQEIPYIDRRPEGVIKDYYPTGSLRSERPHLGGKEHGTSRNYDENGQLVSRAEYQYGLL